MTLAVDLLHPSAETEKRSHKLKRLVQSPNSYFMDVKCPGCFAITTVFSHAQTVVLCGSCATVLCQPTGGKARLTEGSSFRRKKLSHLGHPCLFCIASVLEHRCLHLVLTAIQTSCLSRHAIYLVFMHVKQGDYTQYTPINSNFGYTSVLKLITTVRFSTAIIINCAPIMYFDLLPYVRMDAGAL